MELFTKKGHHLSYQPSLVQGVQIGITTRGDGVSAYPNAAFNMARYIDDKPENITHHQEVLAQEIGIPRAQWVFPIQTHEANVVEVTQADRGKNIDALSKDTLHGFDAMFTYDEDTMLTMCYADCVPIYFYSRFSSLYCFGTCRLAGHCRNYCTSCIRPISL